jgi:cytoskeletal protein CcmA (bactofilin family)
VVVGGTIHGNVSTSGRLEILATGKVFGDIVVGSLIIDEGGILRGKSAVHGEEANASVVSVGVRGEAAVAAA